MTIAGPHPLPAASRSLARQGRGAKPSTKSSQKRRRPLPPRRDRAQANLGKQFTIEYADQDDGEYDVEELTATFHLALHTLSKSPTFNHMMRETGRQPYTVIFDDTMEEYGAIDPDDRIIYLSSHAPAEQIISTLAHEIRHAHQYKTIMGTEQVDRLKKRDFVVWNMLLEADAASTEAQVLAELGDDDIAQAARQSSADMPYYRTVHAAFNRAAKQDPKAITDGRAQLAAFKRYFGTKLVEIYKDGFGEYFKELREDGVSADKTIPDHAAKAIGWHHSAGNYLDQDKRLANRTGASLRKNPAFFGDRKRKKGRNQRLMDPRRVALAERCEALNIPHFARPQRPQGVTGRPLRPF